ncbi:MAG: DUF86 domain-containing protein [Clostridia bacterium]|jgi:uncharacterized protein YutE (UPF0331/DUF86 family)|nr:DUF86 domain-containing protein [Clostridia bacterium]
MGKVELDIILEKLAALQGYYKELKELEHISFEEYARNSLYKRTVERLIQLIVEAGTDINNMLLKSLHKGPTADYYSSFIELAEAGVLPMEFALNIAPSTGLRNVIIHEYQKIDDRKVYDSIKNTLKYYLQYMKLINDYLNQL